MSGGAGEGDIASFATDVGRAARAAASGSRCSAHKALRRRPRQALRLREPRRLGLPRHPDRQPAGATSIDGGPGDDHARSAAAAPTRSTAARAATAARAPKAAPTSCGKEAPPKALRLRRSSTRRPAAAPACRSSAAAAATSSSSPSTKRPRPSASPRRRALAIGPGCSHAPAARRPGRPARPNGPGRWLMADLGPGNDSLRVEGSLEAVGSVRLAGGFGNDTIQGGPEDDLIEAGPGADKLYGGDGADGLVGGLPGPTFLYGEGNGDLLAAGGGCAGGAIVGGPGRDDASFAETQAHPGLLIISFPAARRLDRRGQGLRPRPPRPDQRGHGGLLRLGRPDRRRPPQRDARPARRGPLLRQRRRRRHRRPRRRPRLLDPVRPRHARRRRSRSTAKAARPKPAKPRAPATRGPRDHRLLRPRALQLRLRQTRRPQSPASTANARRRSASAFDAGAANRAPVGTRRGENSVAFVLWSPYGDRKDERRARIEPLADARDAAARGRLDGASCLALGLREELGSSSAAGVGRLQRHPPGCLRGRASAADLEGHCWAAVLGAEPNETDEVVWPAVASHGSAAYLWGLLPLSRRKRSMSRRRPGGGRSAAFRVHFASILAPEDRGEREGIPVTSVPRTLLDLRRSRRRPDQLERCLERAEELGLFDLVAVEALLDRAGGHRGARAPAAGACRLPSPTPPSPARASSGASAPRHRRPASRPLDELQRARLRARRLLAGAPLRGRTRRLRDPRLARRLRARSPPPGGAEAARDRDDPRHRPRLEREPEAVDRATSPTLLEAPPPRADVRRLD